MIKVNDIYDLILETLESGKTFNMPIKGTSMQPLLHTGDVVELDKPLDIKPNDIVFYRRNDGHYVMHRVYQINYDNSYDMVGDHQIKIETGIKPEQCFAKVISYTKKGKKHYLKGFCYKFYLLLLKSFYIRRVLIKCLH